MPRSVRLIAWSELVGGILGFVVFVVALVRGVVPGGIVNGALALCAFAAAASSGWLLRKGRPSGLWGSVAVYVLQCFQIGTTSIVLQFVCGLEATLSVRATEWKVSPGVNMTFSAASVLGDREPFVAVNFFALWAVAYLLWRITRSGTVAGGASDGDASGTAVQQHASLLVCRHAGGPVLGSLRMSHLVRVLCLVVALTACEAEAAQISVAYRADAIVPRAQTSVMLFDGQRRYVIEGPALLPANGKDSPRPTGTSGEATADIAMRDAQGVIATGQVTLALKPDWIWDIELHVDSVNPYRSCFGCVGSRSFPLRTGVGRTVRDSLWVTWGGNSIRNPVVY